MFPTRGKPPCLPCQSQPAAHPTHAQSAAPSALPFGLLRLQTALHRAQAVSRVQTSSADVPTPPPLHAAATVPVHRSSKLHWSAAPQLRSIEIGAPSREQLGRFPSPARRTIPTM